MSANIEISKITLNVNHRMKKTHRERIDDKSLVCRMYIKQCYLFYICSLVHYHFFGKYTIKYTQSGAIFTSVPSPRQFELDNG